MVRLAASFVLLACVVVGATRFARAEDEKATIPDQERIRGAWRVISAKDEGRNRPKEIGRLDLFDTAKLHIIMPDGRRTTYRYELEPSLDPKRITLQTLDELVTFTGIYKLEGDMLTVCTCYKPGVIPTEFTTKLRDGRLLLILKRDTDH